MLLTELTYSLVINNIFSAKKLIITEYNLESIGTIYNLEPIGTIDSKIVFHRLRAELEKPLVLEGSATKESKSFIGFFNQENKR